jgi:hypothetical protein
MPSTSSVLAFQGSSVSRPLEPYENNARDVDAGATVVWMTDGGESRDLSPIIPCLI